ncbi:MAG TPA: LysM domain-containing protein, partial [Spirochaetales bacterium]|nr:LysM domain-containing protein [Spirochaetales bacterium]
MDMESVIGHQTIQRRRSCVPIITRKSNLLEQARGLFAPRDRRFKHPAVPGIHAGGSSLIRMAQDVRGRQPKPGSRLSLWATPPFLQKKTDRSKQVTKAAGSAHGKRSFAVSPGELVRKAGIPAGVATCGIVLVLAAMGALRAYDPMPSLRAFALPADQLLAGALITALSPLPAEPLAEGTLPSLPLSLSMDTHTVSAGQTLDAIARRYNVRIDTLISL